MMFEANKKRGTLMKIKNLIAIFSVIVSFSAGAYTSWENSPNNWKNNPSNVNAKNGFYDNSGERIGYCVGQNCFKDGSGDRIGYGFGR